MFIHGIDCDTQTFPTKCNYCGEKVYYFSCTCGSKVFFNELGSGWPKHSCRDHGSDSQWARQLPKTNLKRGGLRVELAPGITVTRPGVRSGNSWNIDPKIAAKVKREERSRDQNPIESVPPGIETVVEITGVIRELIRGVDVYKRFKVSRSSMNAAFLRMLGTGNWNQITIHDLRSVIYSYSFWILDENLPSNGLRIGTTATVRLEREDFPLIQAREWVCELFNLE